MAVKTSSKEQKETTNFVLPRATMSLMKMILILSVFVGLSFFLLRMPNLWPIEKIAVIGDVKHVTQKQLASILSSEGNAGMLTVDLSDLRHKISQMPWVKNVQIRKSWPDTLSFIFEEYEPIAIVNNSYLTETGNLVEQSGYQHKEHILTLVINESKIGKPLDLLLLVKRMQKIQKSLTSHQLAIENMEISESNSWLIRIENKFLIKIGRKKQLERIENFLQVYAAIENKNKLESIDLRYSNGLAVKLSNEPLESKQNG